MPWSRGSRRTRQPGIVGLNLGRTATAQDAVADYAEGNSAAGGTGGLSRRQRIVAEPRLGCASCSIERWLASLLPPLISAREQTGC